MRPQGQRGGPLRPHVSVQRVKAGHHVEHVEPVVRDGGDGVALEGEGAKLAQGAQGRQLRRILHLGGHCGAGRERVGAGGRSRAGWNHRTSFPARLSVRRERNCCRPSHVVSRLFER